MSENSPALHLAEEQAFPVPYLGTDRNMSPVSLSQPHHSWLWDWDMVVICRGQYVLGFHPAVNLYMCSHVYNQIQGLRIPLTPSSYMHALPPAKLFN